MKIKKHLPAILVVTFWLIMMGLLLKEFVIDPNIRFRAKPMDREALVENIPDVSEWMLIKSGDKILGPFVMELMRDPQTQRFTTSLRLMIDLSKIGSVGTASATSLALLDEELNLLNVKLRASIPLGSLFVDGTFLNDELTLYALKGKSLQRKRISLKGRVSFYDLINPLMARRIPREKGAVYKMPVFDPIWSMQRGFIYMEVLDEEEILIDKEYYNSYKIETTFNGVKRHIWVDEEGKTLRHQLWGNIVLERSSEQRVVELYPGLSEEISFPEVEIVRRLKESQGDKIEEFSQKGILSAIRR